MKLQIPVVEPAKSETLKTLKGIRNPKSYLYSFRKRSGLFVPIPHNVRDFQFTICTESFVERPQMILIGIQKKTTNDQKFNRAIIYHANVETIIWLLK